MASAFLGPESHVPLSVITERYLKSFQAVCWEDEHELRFGTHYLQQLYSVIDEYLQLDTSDRLMYIGDVTGSIFKDLESHFCLTHQVQAVTPVYVPYMEAAVEHKALPVKDAHVGAEEYFRNLAQDHLRNKVKYNKMLVNNSVRYLEHPTTAFQNMSASLAAGGRLLIIHRTGYLNTLPYFSSAFQRLVENDICHDDIIRDLRRCNFDVTWKVECLPVCMPKKTWLAMLKSLMPTQLFSEQELASGARELSEGILKYQGDVVNFVDRLVFISATARRCPESVTASGHHCPAPVAAMGHYCLNCVSVRSDQAPGGQLKTRNKQTNTESLPKPAALKYLINICPQQVEELMNR